MSKLKVSGNASGTGVITLEAPNTNTDRTITLPDGDISLGVGIDDNATSTKITVADTSVSTVGVRSYFSAASENFALGVRYVSTGGTLYFGASSASATPDGGIYNAGGSQILGFGNDRNVTIPAGNLVIGTSGKGIDFSATSDGSGTMTSEVLDDYEEGTWTPTTNGDATGVFSGSVYGKYVKVGTLVYATFNFTVSTSFTGNSIGGLPYAVGSLSGSSVRPSMPIWFNAGSSDYMIMTTIGGGGSYVGFSKFSGYQAWSPLINNNIRGTVIYQSA